MGIKKRFCADPVESPSDGSLPKFRTLDAQGQRWEYGDEDRISMEEVDLGTFDQAVETWGRPAGRCSEHTPS